MNTLVIGGSGFIGEYLCRALVQDGVISVIRPGTDEKEKIAGVRYEEIDLDRNFLDLKKIMSEIDRIVWALQPDIGRMRNILSVIKDFGNVKKMVYLSTLLVYVSSTLKQDELSVLGPETDYEKKKYEEEELLSEFATNANRSLCIARLGNVYGDVKNRGVVNHVLLSLINKTPFCLNGDGKNLRDFIFVEDAVILLSGLVRRKNSETVEVFNVCTGESNSLITLVNHIEKIVGRKINIQNVNDKERIKSVVGDNQKILRALNILPQYNLANGLKKTYDNYLNHHKFNQD